MEINKLIIRSDWPYETTTQFPWQVDMYNEGGDVESGGCHDEEPTPEFLTKLMTEDNMIRCEVYFKTEEDDTHPKFMFSFGEE